MTIKKMFVLFRPAKDALRNARSAVMSYAMDHIDDEKGMAHFFYVSLTLSLMFLYQIHWESEQSPTGLIATPLFFKAADNQGLCFDVVHAVWGERYRDIMVRFGLPTQLAPGNLPALSSGGKVRYLFYTTQEDARMIRDLPVMRRVADYAEIRFIPIDVLMKNGGASKFSNMTTCHNHAIQNLAGTGRYVIISTPDAIFANGTFEQLLVRAQQGDDYVFVNTGLRLSLEKMSGPLVSFTRSEVIDLPPRTLVSQALNAMSKIARGLFWEGPIHSACPTVIFWDVPGEGVLSYAMHQHLFMLRAPRCFTPFMTSSDGDLLISNHTADTRIYIAKNSDELCVFSLSMDGDDRGWNLPGPYSAPYFTRGLQHSADVFQRGFMNFRYELRAHAPTPRKWDEVDAKARTVMQTALRFSKEVAWSDIP